MKFIRFGFGSMLFLAILAVASQAQVQRTFVSGLGSDGNPCSRMGPCRTFGQAISQTNAGGEVIVLDSAGYGPVIITKSISLIASPGVYAGISVFSGDGIDINAGASDTVTLRGLTVNNQASMGVQNGVVFNTGAKLHVEGCVISGFAGGDTAGLRLLAGSEAQVEVIDSIMRGSVRGILVTPLSGRAQVTIDHVRFEGNTQAGLLALPGSQVTVTNSVAASNQSDGFVAFSSDSGSVQMSVESSVVSGGGAGVEAQSSGTGAVQVNVTRCVISGSNIGIAASSFSTGVATVRVSSSTVIGTDTGFFNRGAPALFLSRGDNTVEGNTVNTVGTIGQYTAK